MGVFFLDKSVGQEFPVSFADLLDPNGVPRVARQKRGGQLSNASRNELMRWITQENPPVLRTCPAATLRMCTDHQLGHRNDNGDRLSVELSINSAQGVPLFRADVQLSVTPKAHFQSLRKDAPHPCEFVKVKFNEVDDQIMMKVLQLPNGWNNGGDDEGDEGDNDGGDDGDDGDNDGGDDGDDDEGDDGDNDGGDDGEGDDEGDGGNDNGGDNSGPMVLDVQSPRAAALGFVARQPPPLMPIASPEEIDEHFFDLLPDLGYGLADGTYHDRGNFFDEYQDNESFLHRKRQRDESELNAELEKVLRDIFDRLQAHQGDKGEYATEEEKDLLRRWDLHADIAYIIPKLDSDESMEAGAVVYVVQVDGQLRCTKQVVTKYPIFGRSVISGRVLSAHTIGTPYSVKGEPVVYMGHAYVNVDPAFRDKVEPGVWLVASGRGDGLAVPEGASGASTSRVGKALSGTLVDEESGDIIVESFVWIGRGEDDQRLAEMDTNIKMLSVETGSLKVGVATLKAQGNSGDVLAIT